MIDFYRINGIIQSVNPPETAFGYSYWSYMIPPFKPKSVLILGAGQGTIENLIKKIWGEVISITSVDIKVPAAINMDAREYVRICNHKYDYVVVDIGIGADIPDFVFSEEFVKDLAKITGKLLAINVLTLGKPYNMEYYEKYFNTDFYKTCLYNKIQFYKAKSNKEVYLLP